MPFHSKIAKMSNIFTGRDVGLGTRQGVFVCEGLERKHGEYDSSFLGIQPNSGTVTRVSAHSLRTLILSCITSRVQSVSIL